MFNFLHKSFFRHNGRCTSKAPSTYKFHSFPSLILVQRISSNSTQESFTLSYLVNSCGLSPESAFKASKSVKTINPEKANPILSFFQNHGFTKPQISNIIKCDPKVLWSNPEKTLLPKIEFLRSKGFSNSDLAHVLSVYPWIFRKNLKNYFINAFDYLSNLLQSSEKTISIIKRFPLIFSYEAVRFLSPNVDILRENGVSESNIVRLVCYWPSIYRTKPDKFKEVVNWVKEISISPLNSQFVIAIVVLLTIKTSEWTKKVKVYKNWGLSEEEIFAAFRKCPWIMIASEDKIMAILDLFVNRMGWESSYIARHPVLITLSLEKRIIPRVAVFQLLLLKGLLKENTSLATTLKYPENTFLQRFVNSYDEAPQLLNLYQEKKLNPSKMTE